MPLHLTSDDALSITVEVISRNEPLLQEVERPRGTPEQIVSFERQGHAFVKSELHSGLIRALFARASASEIGLLVETLLNAEEMSEFILSIGYDNNERLVPIHETVQTAIKPFLETILDVLEERSFISPSLPTVPTLPTFIGPFTPAEALLEDWADKQMSS